MTPFFKKYGQVLLAASGALAVIGTALWFKGTEHENTWLYIFCVWCFISAAFEIYATWKKNKNKDQ